MNKIIGTIQRDVNKFLEPHKFPNYFKNSMHWYKRRKYVRVAMFQLILIYSYQNIHFSTFKK